ncbi:MAG: C1 family peptidase [Ignavibacteriaceae bacterium]
MKIFFLSLISISFLYSGLAQTQIKDKALFNPPQKGYYQNYIQVEVDKFNSRSQDTPDRLTMDYSPYTLPKSVDEFKSVWHNTPINQGITGTCWSFCTTSFYESEVYRLHKKKILLSQMWTAYWEFVEKAKGFVKSRGATYFGEGSQSNATKRIYRTYGIVPFSAYSGKLPGQLVFDHSKMYQEMTDYLEFVKKNNLWSEDDVVANIKSILNFYMGTPPESFSVDGSNYTPKSYFEKVFPLNLDDYVDFMSLMQAPFYELAEYPVPDNWWHSKEYHNIPITDFMAIVKNAIRTGFSVCIGGDVSEPGIDGFREVAMIPTFDIPAEYIDDNSRQFRFSNKTSEDDHGIHLVGYKEQDGKDWYMIKDSGSGAQNGNNKGYYFYHEDFVKLKMLSFSVHKDVAKDILAKFKK